MKRITLILAVTLAAIALNTIPAMAQGQEPQWHMENGDCVFGATQGPPCARVKPSDTTLALGENWKGAAHGT